MANGDLDISVLVATHNRAAFLRATLDRMTRVHTGDLAVEFVVIDNNSNDGTRQVVEEFRDRLRITYLFEPRPGKNVALNKALREVELGSIVVFTDDDVAPAADWFEVIHRATEADPDEHAFGGKVRPVFPMDPPPKWVNSPMIREWAYCWHDMGDKKMLYPSGKMPFGPNMWVRRAIFDSGKRFNETVGPRPKNRIMGSESTFLKSLVDDGHDLVYVPEAVVDHLITEEMIDKRYMIRRAFRFGRLRPRLHGLPNADLAQRHSTLWRLRRMIGLVVNVSRHLFARACAFTDKGFLAMLLSSMAIGSDYEALIVEKEQAKDSVPN